MSLQESLDLIRHRWPDAVSTATDEPVFVLAAGWRSGSTMLQRMLMKNCLVWGEPFGSSGLIERLSHMLRRFAPNWPKDEFFLDSPHWEGELAGEWIANLYPSMQSLLDAHVQFFRTLLAEPSRLKGFQRWGLKEVRYGIDHAHYLRWLFPKARFLFLIRNPFDCWASYRRSHSRVLRFWPEELITTPEQFGRHWLNLTEGFVARFKTVGGLVIRHEALRQPDFKVKELEDYLGFDVDRQAGQKVVGASPAGQLDAQEMVALDKIVGPLAKRLGYVNPYGETKGK